MMLQNDLCILQIENSIGSMFIHSIKVFSATKNNNTEPTFSTKK